jgi:hypothetical protein
MRRTVLCGLIATDDIAGWFTDNLSTAGDQSRCIVVTTMLPSSPGEPRQEGGTRLADDLQMP